MPPRKKAKTNNPPTSPPPTRVPLEWPRELTYGDIRCILERIHQNIHDESGPSKTNTSFPNSFRDITISNYNIAFGLERDSLDKDTIKKHKLVLPPASDIRWLNIFGTKPVGRFDADSGGDFDREYLSLTPDEIAALQRVFAIVNKELVECTHSKYCLHDGLVHEMNMQKFERDNPDMKMKRVMVPRYDTNHNSSDNTRSDS